MLKKLFNQKFLSKQRRLNAPNGTVNLTIAVENISPETFGEMVYFFEKACAVSCYLDGVNPFVLPAKIVPSNVNPWTFAATPEKFHTRLCSHFRQIIVSAIR